MKKSQIKTLIEKNGRQSELLVCTEELSELIQAISKCERNRLGDDYSQNDLDNLYEEIADVQIVIKLLKQLFRLDPNRIQAWQRRKEQRTVKRYGL